MTNILQNPNFDDNNTGAPWIVSGVSIITFDSDPPVLSLPNSAKVASNQVNAIFSQAISLIAGNVYQLTLNINPVTALGGTGSFVRIIYSNSTIQVFLITQPLVAGEWETNTFTFVATTNSATLYIVTNTDDDSVIAYDDFSLIDITPICFAGYSIVYTRNLLTGEICNTLASAVKAGVHEVYNTREQKFVPVMLNVNAGTTKRYRKIKAHSLGHNKPFEDFYVTNGHRILINDVEIKARCVPGAKTVKVKPEPIYSIYTDDKCPILINGLDVMTHSYKKNANLANNKPSNHVRPPVC